MRECGEMVDALSWGGSEATYMGSSPIFRIEKSKNLVGSYSGNAWDCKS